MQWKDQIENSFKCLTGRNLEDEKKKVNGKHQQTKSYKILSLMKLNSYFPYRSM